MKHQPAAVQCVLPLSIAEEAGIEQGDAILSINGEKIKDIFDYRFLIADSELVLEVLKKNGEIWSIEVEKDEYEDLGIDFEFSMIDREKSCTNKCIFCFIDQLPPGMRDTLYFKDDDSRLSFLTGNYVTLTNMSDGDIDRIIRYRMSPINVSVHCTNPRLRKYMLKNRFAGNILDRIQKLTSHGIEINCQIVLCRGINDGEELDRTIFELAGLRPGIRSISIVPVGISRYREGLERLEPYGKESSAEVIGQVHKWQKRLHKKYGSRLAYLSDEFYIMAGAPLPEYEEYEDFPQIENGVGLAASLKHEFYEFLEAADLKCISPRKVSIATGISASALIRELSGVLERRLGTVTVNVFAIKNEFFGENVTVTGLLTGRDIISQLKDKALGEELLISASMLKAGERILLDDCSIETMEQQLNVKITVVENDGKDFIEKVVGKII